jgi:hypothetical protein
MSIGFVLPSPSTAHYRNAAGTETGSGPMDLSAHPFREGHPLDPAAFRVRYGGVPIDDSPTAADAQHEKFHPLVGAAEMMGALSASMMRAFEAGALGNRSLAVATFDSRPGEPTTEEMHDLAYGAPALASSILANFPAAGTDTTPSVSSRVRPTGLSAITSTAHWPRTTYWQENGAAGHEADLFAGAVAWLRVKRVAGTNIDEVSMTQDNVIRLQPSLLLAALDELDQLRAAQSGTPGA